MPICKPQHQSLLQLQTAFAFPEISGIFGVFAENAARIEILAGWQALGCSYFWKVRHGWKRPWETKWETTKQNTDIYSNKKPHLPFSTYESDLERFH